MKKAAHFLWCLVFILYCALMLWLLFDRNRYDPAIPYWDQVQQNMNLTPFHTIRLYVRLFLNSERPVLVKVAAVNLLGNVAMFIPLGFLLPKAFPRMNRLWKVLLTTALTITAVEIIQLLGMVGSCDVDDLILNVCGAALGYWIVKRIP